MSVAEPKMSCGGCGKSVAWKPQYAGKRLKCKCGFVMVGPPAAPARVSSTPVKSPTTVASAPGSKAVSGPVQKAVTAPPPPPKADEAGDDFEALLAQAEEYAVAEEATKPKPKPVRAVAIGASAGGAGAVALPASPMLGYARTMPRKPDEAAARGMLHDVYAPLGLLVVGVLVRFLDAHVRGLHDPAIMTAFVMITCTINLVLVFSALLIGVKLMDLGLGTIGPALLKIAAVALLPSAIGDITRYYTFGIVAWPMTVIMYYALLYFLFQLDGSEMWIVVAIIWLMQTWVSLLILALLFGVMGIGLRSSAHGGLSAAGPASSPTRMLFSGGGGASDREKLPPDPDQLAADEIRDGTAVEFTKWIKPDMHGVMRGTRQMALDQADKFYAAGAKSVWAMKIEKQSNTKLEICHEMVIELPDRPAAREAVRKAIYGFDFPSSSGGRSEGSKRFIHLPLD